MSNTKPKFKTRYTEARNKIKEFGTKIEGESLTDASQAEETDIKTMCAKYGLKSILARSEVTEAMYGYDLTGTTDFRERLEIRERMKEYFYQQPAKIRKEFKDNFTQFYEMYLTGNTQRMEELGILERKKINETNQVSQSDSNSNVENTNQNDSPATAGNS